MDTFKNVLDIIQQVIEELKKFFEGLFATLKGEDDEAAAE